jgi:rhodanese-related sulfurtransferase
LTVSALWAQGAMGGQRCRLHIPDLECYVRGETGGQTMSRQAMTAAEAVEAAAAGDVVLLDVRGADELARSGRAAGAVHVPLAQLLEAAAAGGATLRETLPRDKPVAVYCAAGGRAGRAAEALRAVGFSEVHNIGGLGDWISAGGPLD